MQVLWSVGKWRLGGGEWAWGVCWLWCYRASDVWQLSVLGERGVSSLASLTPLTKHVEFVCGGGTAAMTVGSVVCR